MIRLLFFLGEKEFYLEIKKNVYFNIIIVNLLVVLEVHEIFAYVRALIFSLCGMTPADLFGINFLNTAKDRFLPYLTGFSHHCHCIAYFLPFLD
jgi:hypothetical protein